MDNLERTGAICKSVRVHYNVSRETMAERTGYSKWTIRQFEQGKNNNLSLFMEYAKLGMNVKRVVETWQ